MNRRNFILSSTAAAVTVPVAYYFKKDKWKKYNPIYVPSFLSTICDEVTIKAIGSAYLKKHPNENSKEKLKTAVLANGTDTPTLTVNEFSIIEFINTKIFNEYKSGNTLLTNGWLLSQTEARQCALFSLTY